MTKTRKILIAVDGSPDSHDAVRYVGQTCTPEALEVSLMHVMPTVPKTLRDLDKEAFFTEEMKHKYAQWKRKREEAAEAFLVNASNILVKAKIDERRVRVILQQEKMGLARDILGESERGYDAIVLGRSGFSKPQGFFLGSVSRKVVEGVEDIPVWVVGGEIKSRRILLAVDVSDNSHRAVVYAGDFTASTEAELTLYHVVRSFGLGIVDENLILDEEMQERFVEEVQNDVPRMFSGYSESLKRSGVARTCISSKHTFPSYSRAADILREAKEGGYGTIVIGRKGLSGAPEFLMGSVTNKVLSRAKGFAVWIVP
ncbi:MAG: universal stress protein [Deltaproteobacteria bacterium]|nr:MAG: universal stress protein [Deltaproteobacteria bacterium]